MSVYRVIIKILLVEFSPIGGLATFIKDFNASTHIMNLHLVFAIFDKMVREYVKVKEENILKAQNYSIQKASDIFYYVNSSQGNSLET